MDYGLVIFSKKCLLFYTCTHAQCRIYFFQHVKFYIQFRQLISGLGSVVLWLWGEVRSHKHYFQVIFYTPYQRSSSVKGRLPLLGPFHFWVWHSSPQPFVICVFELVYLNDLHYFSLWAGPPQWPLLRWISRWYCQRGWRQRGPKILNICCTESYHTKNWGRMPPGIYWCYQEYCHTSYDAWQHRAVSPRILDTEWTSTILE